MALETVIQGANTVLKTLGGLRVHDDAPESMSQLPATILVANHGQIDWPRKPSQRTTTHDLALQLFVNRGSDLTVADRILKPWMAKIVDLFDQNITLKGNAIQAGIVDYKYGVLDYAGTSYLGITFTLRAVEYEVVQFQG